MLVLFSKGFPGRFLRSNQSPTTKQELSQITGFGNSAQSQWRLHLSTAAENNQNINIRATGFAIHIFHSKLESDPFYPD